MALPLLAVIFGVHSGCPNQGDGCPGTAAERAAAAVSLARSVDLNQPWPLAREAIVRACGLRVQHSTSHCFNDFNHV